jgi:hypothetical protein
MAYRITGLTRAAFAKYFSAGPEELAAMNAIRVVAQADRGYPCRVSLDDARAGESLILLHYVSHDVANPFRSAYAIYVREQAEEATPFVDRLPPFFAGRPLSLRGFDADGMLHEALVAGPEAQEEAIHKLLDMPEVACIHAHYAAYGCFAARIERDGEGW